MNLKESDYLLLELAHLSIDESNNLKDHNAIWNAFKIGIEYNKQIENERNCKPLDKD